MHQKCHIDSRLQRKSSLFLPLQVLKKTMYRKKGHGDKSALETNLQSHVFDEASAN